MSVDPLLDEEPWEADLGAMLHGLPLVEPPAGFLDAAIDHRPHRAGRTVLGLLGATLALIVVITATGAVDRAGVVPPIDELVDRHDLAARAGLQAGGDDGAAPSVVDNPLSLPEGFEEEGAVAVEDLRQAVFARGDESVSIFVQEGRVDWSGLPDEGLTELGALPAWVDGERRIAIIGTSGSTVTVVGLEPAELERALQGAPGSSSGVWDRLGELAEAVVEVFGYAPAG